MHPYKQQSTLLRMKRISYILSVVILAAVGLGVTTVHAEYGRYPQKSENTMSIQEYVKHRFKKNTRSASSAFDVVNPAESFFSYETAEGNPFLSTAERIFKSPTAPEGNIYAIVPSGRIQMAANAGAFGKLDCATGAFKTLHISEAFQIDQIDYQFQGGTDRNGLLYIPSYDQDMIDMTFTTYWNVVDPNTGETVNTIRHGNNFDWMCYTITYDPSRDCFYGLTLNPGTGAGGSLVRVNCNGKPEDEWTLDFMGIDLGGSETTWMNTLVYNPNDRLVYCLNVKGEFLTWNPDDPDKAPVTVYRFDNEEDSYCFPQAYTSWPLVYSPKDHAFIGISRDNTAEAMVVYSIDAETFETHRLSHMNPLGFVASLHCFDAFAPDNAPAQVSELKTNLVNDELSAPLSFRMPSTNFVGVAYEAGKELEYRLYIDGTLFKSGKNEAGKLTTVPVNYTVGSHEVIVTCYDGELEGAPVTLKIYAGPDAPLAPTNFTFNDYVFSWSAPGNGSANGGYINPDQIYYVLYDGDQIIASELYQTSVRLSRPAELGRHNFSVTAVYSGQESSRSSRISRVVGPAQELPVSYTPTKEEADLFDIINNGDRENYFRFSENNGTPCFELRTEQYYQHPDDYFYLPSMNFSDDQIQYRLSFMTQNAQRNDKHVSDLEIRLQKSFVASADDKIIYTHSDESYADPTLKEIDFTVPAAGEYYIVFYESGDTTDDSPYPLHRGSRYWQIGIEPVYGSSTLAPDEITDVVATPILDGTNRAKISFTAPVKSLEGTDLAADKLITFTAECEEKTSSATALPGAKVEMTVEAATNGSKVFRITPSTEEEGTGKPTMVPCYVGLDTPGPITDTKCTISDDNMTMHISWSAPKVGLNGGYINPDDIIYDINYQSGTLNYVKVGETKETHFDYTTSVAGQANYSVGPVARNAAGSSTNNIFAYALLGTPHPIPMVEEFPTGGMSFDYSRWGASATGEYANVAWENAPNLDGSGVGNPVCTRGLFFAYVQQGNSGKGQLLAPKFSTAGVPSAQVKVSYWNYMNAASMEFWASSSKSPESKKIGELTPSGAISPQWEDFAVQLPEEYLDCGWVRVNLVTNHPSANHTCIIDNYAVLQTVDHDFRVTALNAPYSVTIGQDATFSGTCVNAGSLAGRTSFTIELLADGEQVGKRIVSTGRMQANSSYEMRATFPINVDYSGKRLKIRASVESDFDAVENNNVMEADLILKESEYPLVNDLSATEDDNKQAVLTWSDPDTEMQDGEGFEAMQEFGTHIQLGRWTNIDVDKHGNPYFLAANGGSGVALEWEDYDKAGAWQVINAETLGLMEDERITPRSGRNFLLARSTSETDDSGKPLASQDWFISPAIEGGTQLSFWYNTLHSDYSETVSVFYSLTDNKIDEENGIVEDATYGMRCGSFLLGRHFTKSGVEGWERVTWNIPAGAKYIALVYRSIGQFGAMIDDIDVKYVDPGKWNVESYNVYRFVNNVPTLIGSNLTSNTFTDETFGSDAFRSYAVCGNVTDPNGVSFLTPYSNRVSVGEGGENGVDGVDANGIFIGGGKGFILFGGLAGEKVSVYSADGKLVRKLTLSADRQSVDVSAGIYVISTAKVRTKVLVK